MKMLCLVLFILGICVVTWIVIKKYLGEPPQYAIRDGICIGYRVSDNTTGTVSVAIGPPEDKEQEFHPGMIVYPGDIKPDVIGYLPAQVNKDGGHNIAIGKVDGTGRLKDIQKGTLNGPTE